MLSFRISLKDLPHKGIFPGEGGLVMDIDGGEQKENEKDQTPTHIFLHL